MSERPGDDPRLEPGLAAQWFWLGLGGLVLATLAFPLIQLVGLHGPVYYTNGFDESTYLNYAYSQIAQAASRPGQYLVTGLHRLGWSGGQIDMGFDTVALIGFACLARAGFRAQGSAARQANLATAILLAVPMIALASNPLVRALSDWVVRSGAIAWLNVPEAYTSPLVRSPEPQFSLLLLAGITLLALRLKRFWPVYLVLPLLYPFVAIPAAFVLLACHLHARWPLDRRMASAGAIALAFGLIGLLGWVQYHGLISPAMRDFLVPSHAPMVSFTGLLTLGAYAAVRPWLAIERRFAALAIALAPWVASNFQLIAGYMAQPDNFEQYAGCVCLALVLALASRAPVWLRGLPLAIGLALFAYSSYVVVRVNWEQVKRLPLSPALLEDLRRDPAHTVIADFNLAATMSMIEPRGGSTALAFEKTFGPVAGRYIGEYRCIKHELLVRYPQDRGLRTILSYLDNAYAYGSQNYVRVSSGRRRQFKLLQRVEPAECAGPAPSLHVYFPAPLASTRPPRDAGPGRGYIRDRGAAPAAHGRVTAVSSKP